MLPVDSQQAADRLKAFQRAVRDQVIASRRSAGLHVVNRATAADTIYQIDTVVEPILEDFCREWSKTTPLVLIAEGIEDKGGSEGIKIFPQGAREADALIRLIVDPIDGTRGLMYDKRAAWALAGVAPNNGNNTRLRDIEVSVMTELPTSKMGQADVLWAIKNQGARAERIDLSSLAPRPLPLAPSSATGIDHGFATISNFFPGTKVLASELMEYLARHLIGPADVTKATVFEDQYISTGGQFYELMVGHDRFNADLRPLLYRAQKQPEGLCCHPYDCAALLIAEEAGVIITDANTGKSMDGPLDCITGLAWAGYANEALCLMIEPLLTSFLREIGAT
jgi:fructose-1,6-bisphosphatase/inositol monophosphatase family enzyme